MIKCGDASVNALCHRTNFKNFSVWEITEKHENSLRRKSNAGEIIAGDAGDI